MESTESREKTFLCFFKLSFQNNNFSNAIFTQIVDHEQEMKSAICTKDVSIIFSQTFWSFASQLY